MLNILAVQTYKHRHASQSLVIYPPRAAFGEHDDMCRRWTPTIQPDDPNPQRHVVRS